MVDIDPLFPGPRERSVGDGVGAGRGWEEKGTERRKKALQ
jgi:hypothetical protein